MIYHIYFVVSSLKYEIFLPEALYCNWNLMPYGKSVFFRASEISDWYCVKHHLFCMPLYKALGLYLPEQTFSHTSHRRFSEFEMSSPRIKYYFVQIVLWGRWTFTPKHKHLGSILSQTPNRKYWLEDMYNISIICMESRSFNLTNSPCTGCKRLSMERSHRDTDYVQCDIFPFSFMEKRKQAF